MRNGEPQFSTRKRDEPSQPPSSANRSGPIQQRPMLSYFSSVGLLRSFSEGMSPRLGGVARGSSIKAKCESGAMVFDPFWFTFIQKRLQGPVSFVLFRPCFSSPRRSTPFVMGRCYLAAAGFLRMRPTSISARAPRKSPANNPRI